jgi:protoporphyrinogen/coproporphyrinogen III oxidase
MERVVELRPDRLAIYSFAYVPWIRPNQKKIDQAALPQRDAKMGLYLVALERLLAAGYEPIGMDHFALPGDELSRAAREGRLDRNFMGYTVKPTSTMIAFGVSGIGEVAGGFFANEKKLSRYYAALDAGKLPIERGYRLDDDDLVRQYVIRQLMCNFHVDKRDVEQRFGIDFDAYFASSLADLDELRPRASSPSTPRPSPCRPPGACSCATSAWRSTAISRPSAPPSARSSRAPCEDPRMTKHVVVVGGGIAGLATAFELRERASRVPGGLEVQLLEGASRLGGNLRTEHADGYRVEWGPNGFLDNVPATIDLVRRLGRESDLVRANASAARRFLFRNGKLHLLPSGAGSFLTCPVLSIRGRLRVLGEPFAKKHPGGDETVFDFAARRIGPEAAAILVDSMVSGVFAGNSRELSLASCFPKMAEMERDHGGLVRAMVARLLARGAAKREMERRRAAGRDVSELARPGGPAGPGGTLTSFGGGIETFIEALAAQLGDAVAVDRPVRSLDRSDVRGWSLATGGGPAVEADAIVLAIPAAQAAPLVAPLDDVVAATLREIPTAPLAVVALAYDVQAIGSAPNGFGFLVPRGETLRILGCLCDSSIFPGRAPEGKVLVRAMIGGAHDPRAVALGDDELVAVASREVAQAMGFQAEPERHWIFRHRAGISQYAVGHADRLELIQRRLQSWPGLFLAGQSYFGVSMNSCVEKAPAIADQVVASLT